MGRPEDNRARVAILVLGMHRSGTSALARLIGYLGAALPGDAIDAHSDNARGYWESASIVKADDQLLRVARSSWFDPRPLDLSRLDPSALRSRKDRIWEAVTAAFGDAAPLIAIKDPRQCRFVPTVVETLAEHGIVSRAALMLRSPAAIARSIATRDGTTSAFAHLLWLRHMIDAERATRGLMRTAIGFDAMLADWRAAASRLLPLTGGAMPEGDLASAIDDFLDPALRHHEDGAAHLGQPLAGIVEAVSAGLEMLVDRDDSDSRAALDQAYAMFDAVPWLADDIIHDELRHRRTGEGESEAEAAAPLAVGPPRQSMPAPTPPHAEAVAMIRGSGLFDEAWYLATYAEVAESGLDPIEHYLTTGAPKGYNPHPLFDTGFYARQMARRIAAAGGGA